MTLSARWNGHEGGGCGSIIEDSSAPLFALCASSVDQLWFLYRCGAHLGFILFTLCLALVEFVCQTYRRVIENSLLCLFNLCLLIYFPIDLSQTYICYMLASTGIYFIVFASDAAGHLVEERGTHLLHTEARDAANQVLPFAYGSEDPRYWHVESTEGLVPRARLGCGVASFRNSEWMFPNTTGFMGAGGPFPQSPL